MSSNIHSTAIVHSKTIIGSNVVIGSYSIIDENVIIGNNCKIGPYVKIHGNTEIGNGCTIFNSCSIGSDPQDLKYEGEHSKLIIGSNTIIREFCTLNRGTKEAGLTVIGKNCLFMAYVHIAHDCNIGDRVILSNGVQLGGHVSIDNDTSIGGMTPVHQFCQLGEHSFIAGGYRVVQDVPPYILAQGEPLDYCGINSIGLRRKGFDKEKRKMIKEAYLYIYKSNINLSQAIDKINTELTITKEIDNILSFINRSNRGLI